MPDSPTLSVVLTNFNHGKLLRRSLPALALQTRPPLEWILIDDASTDDSVGQLVEFARAHPAATVVRHEKNRGIIASLDEGLRRARGDYVYFAAADDVTLPDLFARLLAAVAAHPGAGVALADFFLFDEKGAIQRRYVSQSSRAAFLSGTDFADLLRSGAHFDYPPSGAIVRREALLALGGHDARTGWMADWWSNLRVGLQHGVCLVPEALAGFRVAADSFSGAGTKKAPDAAVLWTLATEQNTDAGAQEIFWFALMAALPARVRQTMWCEVFRRPRCWPWVLRHGWKLRAWPTLRPWLWPAVQAAARLGPSSLYLSALRMFGAEIAEDAKIGRHVSVNRPWRLRVDQGAAIAAGAKIFADRTVVIGAKPSDAAQRALEKILEWPANAAG